MAISAERWMAVGMTSLEDWPMLTWSFGWTGLLEPSSPSEDLDGPVGDHLVGVHVGGGADPVWNMSRTNALSSRPSTTSSAASTMASLSSFVEQTRARC